VGEYDRALAKVEEAVRKPSPFPALPPSIGGVRPTRQQNDAHELRRQKIRLLQALGRKEEAAAYALAQAKVSPVDADGQWPAVQDAAAAVLALGRTDQAIKVYSDFVQSQETAGAMTSQSAAARLEWAELDAGQGSYFEASEILREVVKQSEGKGWGVYLRTGYAQVYDAAVSRLAQMRVRSQFPVASSDWERPPKPPVANPLPEAAEPTEMDRDLAALLRGTSTGPGRTTFGGAPVSDFIKQYGGSAVPAVIKAAQQGDMPSLLIAQFGLLDRIAAPADAPLVLKAFKTTPRLAETAFRLDATNAAAILRERFGIYSKGGEIPIQLDKVVENYHLQDQYPVLIANFAAKDLNGNTAPNAATLDRIVHQDAPPQVVESFRAALAAVLEKQMLSSYRYYLASLGETAMRNGLPQGIEAVYRGGDPLSTNALPVLRKYIALPPDDARAKRIVETGLGRWRWDAATAKFVAGGTVNQPQP
jgi:tetratricopeptide (TPR) repeat protein